MDDRDTREIGAGWLRIYWNRPPAPAGRRTGERPRGAPQNDEGLIKRREETAATRSLLNTARLMDENPTLMRLKELETLEKVTEKIDKLTVFGGLEGVLKDVVRIQVPRA